MRYGWIIVILISTGLITTAFGSAGDLFKESSKKPHRFSEWQCHLCHVDPVNDSSNRKPIVNSICADCHADVQQSQSHPVDIAFTDISIPGDLPLVNGRLGCITCHYVHPSSPPYPHRSANHLRRPGKGTAFCMACHRVDEKGHVVYETIHRDSYRRSARNSSLDVHSLQCVECHDRHLDQSFGSVSAGKRSPFSAGWKHPVGVSLNQIAAKKPRQFTAPHALPREVRLYNGKIGCGTCHNAFSKEKSMLVMNNRRSRLCLECHIK